MGLSFHYSGKIKDADLIPLLIEEVHDVCAILQWNYHLYDDDDVKGISFSPPECEPVFLTFNNKNELCSQVMLHYDVHPATTISVKIQLAGIEIHKAAIKLLKHLKEVYLIEFELFDEGGYGEALDEEKLNRQFNRYNYLLSEVTNQLKDFKAGKNDTAASLSERLEKFLNERFGRSEF
jgi:hypothetical protein